MATSSVLQGFNIHAIQKSAFLYHLHVESKEKSQTRRKMDSGSWWLGQTGRGQYCTNFQL